MNNNLAVAKQNKCNNGISNLSSKQTPFKKIQPSKNTTKKYNQGNTSKNKASSLIEYKNNNSQLNNEVNNIEKEKELIQRSNDDVSMINKTKFVHNPLLSRIVNDNDLKIDFSTINKEKTEETNHFSYSKLAIKKSESSNKNKSSNTNVYTRLGTHTNYSKYKKMSKPKNSSMVIDNNILIDSKTNSLILNNHNSKHFNNKNNSDLDYDSRKKQIEIRKKNGSALTPCLDQVIEEDYPLKFANKKNLTEMITDRLEVLNFSVGSSFDDKINEEETSIRFSKSRNGDSITRSKVATENKGLRFIGSNSFLDDSINKDSIKCRTSRINDFTNHTSTFNNYVDSNHFKLENKLNYVSDTFDNNEQKKSKVSTNEDTIKSNSNRFEIETIEEQHHIFVKFLHTTRKLVKSQENFERINSAKVNSLNNYQQVYRIEEIDLE